MKQYLAAHVTPSHVARRITGDVRTIVILPTNSVARRALSTGGLLRDKHIAAMTNDCDLSQNIKNISINFIDLV